jgi:hypothetical protein
LKKEIEKTLLDGNTSQVHGFSELILQKGYIIERNLYIQ